MPTTQLADRALIDIAGPDAEHFLQNVLTNDFGALEPGEARPGALLAPQGKVLFDFLVSRRADHAFRLECRADNADDLVKRLMLYRLRAKAEISKVDQDVVAVSWSDDSASSQNESTGLADRRFPEALGVRRHHEAPPAADATPAAWHRLRIAYGVAESSFDYEPGDAFPHDILFDRNGGVGLTKGCYIGQEVVSRMHHRGTARRRLLIAKGNAALPASGTAITANGRPVGTLGTVAGQDGLAIARIDKVKAAMDAGVPLLAGETALALSIPDWAGFAFPETSAGAEAD